MLKTMMTHHFVKTKNANNVSMNWLETIMYKSCVLEFVDIVSHCGLYPTFLDDVNNNRNSVVKEAMDDFNQFKTLLNNMRRERNLGLSTRYKNMLSIWSSKDVTKPASALQVLYPFVHFALMKSIKNKQVKVLSKGSLIAPSGEGEGRSDNFILNDSSRTKLNKLSDFAIDATATVKARKNGTTEKTWVIGMPANARRVFYNTFQNGNSTDKSHEYTYPIENLMGCNSDGTTNRSRKRNAQHDVNHNKRRHLSKPISYFKLDKYRPNKDSDYEDIKALFKSSEVGFEAPKITRPMLAASLGVDEISDNAWNEAEKYSGKGELIAIETDKGVVNELYRLYERKLEPEASVNIPIDEFEGVAKGRKTKNTLFLIRIYNVLSELEDCKWYNNAMIAARESSNGSKKYELDEDVTTLILGFETSVRSLLLDIGGNDSA